MFTAYKLEYYYILRFKQSFDLWLNSKVQYLTIKHGVRGSVPEHTPGCNTIQT